VFPYVAPKAELLEVIEKAYAYQRRGEPYYVGPNCPPETLQKMGVHADGTPATNNPPSPNSLSDVSDAGIVIDDRLSAAPPQHDSLDESDFGDLSEELSGVTDALALGSAPQTAHSTVLVVDDEPDIRRLLRQLLASKGYRVVEAHTGDEALRVLKEMTPDVLVLDAMLPGVHGFEIARRLKASQRYQSVPIVMVSAVYRGWRVAEDLQESFGVDYYIEKPFRMNDLLKAVEAALSTEKTPSDGEAISSEAEKELNAGVEAYRQGRLDEAAAHLERGISVDPVAYRLHFHLGLLYGKMGRIYEAIGALERAVQINSKHFSGVKNLAILYQKAGFRNKATEMWERALRIAPDGPTRESIREHLLTLLQ
jgi:DNA-binding response OmpR family regulator